MSTRTTIEIEPSVLKGIKMICARRTLKVKAVADALLRYAMLRENYIFPNEKNHRDNGK